MQDQYRDKVLSWHYDPRLPLASVWNLFMDFVRDLDGKVGWIINNDIEVHPEMLRKLLLAVKERKAWFVSGIGVDTKPDVLPVENNGDFGGPDFSCYVFTVEGWEKYPFDEGFVPAYCEDVDMHRRMMLGGDGQKIFGVNLPFLHHASATINQEKDGPQKFAPLYAQSEKYFVEKWGGPPNKETVGGLTTPKLQQREWEIFNKSRGEG